MGLPRIRGWDPEIGAGIIAAWLPHPPTRSAWVSVPCLSSSLRGPSCLENNLYHVGALSHATIMATLQYPNFPRANVLVVGSNTVHALLPSTLISQADALLLAHRLEDATDLAEQQRKKLQSMLNVERHDVSGLWSSGSHVFTIPGLPSSMSYDT